MENGKRILETSTNNVGEALSLADVHVTTYL